MVSRWLLVWKLCLAIGGRNSKIKLMTNHKIIIGDSRKMAEIDDESVQLIITSPPYWQLKDYGSKNQIGFDDSYEE